MYLPGSLFLALPVALISCEGAHVGVNSTRQAVVYGERSRVPVEEAGEEVWRIAHSLGFILQDGLGDGACDSYPLVGEVWGLCVDEPMYEEVAYARCSTVVVANGLVATASHCVPTATCEGERLLLGEEALKFEAMGCDARLARECQSVVRRDEERDLVFLAVETSGATPVEPGADLAEGDEVFACGTSFGGPLACDLDGVGVASGKARLDLAAGSSGAPVFHSGGRLAGVLVSGSVDLVEDNGCFREKLIQIDGAEDVGEVLAPTSAVFPGAPAVNVTHGVEEELAPTSSLSPGKCSFGSYSRKKGPAPIVLGALLLAACLRRRLVPVRGDKYSSAPGKAWVRRMRCRQS